VAAAFETQPDTESLLPQTVGVILTDLGGNETTVYGRGLIPRRFYLAGARPKSLAIWNARGL
ncbi:MAG: hypothetical protein II035_04090, partial [Firmicutes bacterium]|nr:hypothetical protein [Bacillota bacterium]